MAPRSVVLAILALLLASAIGGFAADRWARARETADARAGELARAGKLEGAEQRYWALLQAGPATVPLVVSFLESHQNAVESTLSPDAELASGGRLRLRLAPLAPTVDEGAIDAFLARTDLPAGVALLGSYWRGVLRDRIDPGIEHDVVRAADAEPPAPYANELLGHEARARGRLDDAAERLLREGLYFRERAVDAQIALDHWVDEEAWDRLDQALADPRIAAIAPPWLQLRSAIRMHNWKGAVRAFPRALRPPLSLGSTALAAIAALVWGTFCARLGGVSMRPRLRIPLYVVAFALGVASVSLTLIIVSLEEVFLKMNETGDPLRDFLFFTFGVGLREEVSKLVFFAPLLVFLRRKGTRLDVLVCGALVGLGFAAEENLGYLHEGDLSTAMARFLTANFFHMSMTAILAGALDDMIRGGDRDDEGSLKFSRALITVAAMHGIYDFCLSERALGNLSWFSMGVFLLLTRQFLGLVSVARTKERTAHPRVLETFAVGMAIVVGTSFVYASALVGPGPAAAALAEGLLGLAIIVFIFVQELRRV
ncbi:MAG: PrsW family glutamic-type intramembrane protease [Polyangiaceae bacterium]|jgi:protease PrsW